MSVHVKKHSGDCLRPAQTNFVKIFAWFPGDIFLVNRVSTVWMVGTVMCLSSSDAPTCNDFSQQWFSHCACILFRGRKKSQPLLMSTITRLNFLPLRCEWNPSSSVGMGLNREAVCVVEICEWAVHGLMSGCGNKKIGTALKNRTSIVKVSITFHDRDSFLKSRNPVLFGNVFTWDAREPKSCTSPQA